jgi:CRP/FNR family transcriptional regulator
MNRLEFGLVARPDTVCDHDFSTSCEDCLLRGLCLPAALRPDEIAALESIIEYRRIFPANAYIYRKNDRFTALFAIISGAVKTYRTSSDGEISITGCHLPGDLFGFSGVDQEHYATSACALEQTTVCELPFDDIEDVCRDIPGLQSRLLHLMSDRLVDYQDHLMRLSSGSQATDRLAAFLLGLAHRAIRRGEPGTQFRLPMSARDISNYLGVRSETVSRGFSRLTRSGVIAKSKREITILDMNRLRKSSLFTMRTPTS